MAIIQGHDENNNPIIIGKIVCLYSQGMGPTDPYKQHKAWIYKKLETKIIIDGKHVDYLLAGYIDLGESIHSYFCIKKESYLEIQNMESKKREFNLLKMLAYIW